MKDYRGDFLHIGEFELTASRLRVSDPCYSPDVWCSGVLDAKPGTWEAAVLQFTNEQTGGWGVRNAIIAVKHADMKQQFDTDIINKTNGLNKPAGWHAALFEVGVDSGQAGFFDDARFKKHNGGDDESFYEKACDTTLSRMQAGVIDEGAVCNSGYGDGGYVCIFHNSNDEDGLVDFAYIIFICEYEDEEDVA